MTAQRARVTLEQEPHLQQTAGCLCFAGLEILRAFGSVDTSYGLTPDELCEKVAVSDALIIRSETQVAGMPCKHKGSIYYAVSR